jgi:hypothetical protein
MKTQGGPLSGYRIIEIGGIGRAHSAVRFYQTWAPISSAIDRLEPSGPDARLAVPDHR